MTNTEIIASITLVIAAAILFYIANWFRKASGAVFEFLFIFGNLLVLSALWVIFKIFENEFSSLSQLGLSIFIGFMWFYFIMIVVVFINALLKTFKWIRNMWTRRGG